MAAGLIATIAEYRRAFETLRELVSASFAEPDALRIIEQRVDYLEAAVLSHVPMSMAELEAKLEFICQKIIAITDDNDSVNNALNVMLRDVQESAKAKD